MKEIGISKFRINCYAILERVRKTGKPIRITRFGKPFAEVVPTSLDKQKPRRLGSMVGTGRIIGDIVGSISGSDDWKACRD